MAGEGLLEGKSDSADRRKSVLSVTEKALPIVARGQELQKSSASDFYAELYSSQFEAA